MDVNGLPSVQMRVLFDDVHLTTTNAIKRTIDDIRQEGELC
jgi:hypothetical protein